MSSYGSSDSSEYEPEDDLYTSELTARSSRKTHPIPVDVYGSCFHTTGMIVGRGICVEVTHMLFDTGAAATFISPQAVETARLQVYNCEPQEFQLASGAFYTCNKFVRLQLYISGNGQDIHAFVDGKYTGLHMIIGQPTLAKFSAQSNHDIRPGQSFQWTVAGHSGRRIIVDEDDAGSAPTLRKHSYDEGIRSAKRPGETVIEREAREAVEFSEDDLATHHAHIDMLKLQHAHLLARHRHYVRVRHDGWDRVYEEYGDDYEEYDAEFGTTNRGNWLNSLKD
jgi:hypothetical protein